jgi:hypothetical protein
VADSVTRCLVFRGDERQRRTIYSPIHGASVVQHVSRRTIATDGFFKGG